MKLFKFLPTSISISLFIGLLCRYISAATFQIRNDCLYTVWAASLPVGGGRRLDPGQAWNLAVSSGTTGGRIWARTNCTFDETGNGTCLTGDCGKLQCTSFGSPPNTIAEYALNQFNNLDFFDISLVVGFNVPMQFSPVSTESKGCNLVEYAENEYIGNNLYISTDEGINVQLGFGDSTSTSSGCSGGVECSADINGECPSVLKAPGGCNNPCTVFKTGEYCCTSGNCGATNYSKYFKDRCPYAYSYPKDDATSTFTCPGGTNYRVVFCPIDLEF